MKKMTAKYIFLGLALLLAFFTLTACRMQEDKAAAAGVASPEVKAVSVNDSGDAATAAVAQYQGQEPLPADIARIKARGKLIVAMYKEDRPPFFYIDQTGRLAGIDVSLAIDIARWLGVKTEFERSAASFDGVVDQVVTGQADIAISKLSVTLNRAQRVSFTRPYVVFQQTMLVNRLKLAALQSQNQGQDPVQLILQSTDKIAIRTATSYVDYAKQTFPNAEIVQIDATDGMIQAAGRGEVIAAFYDNNELQSYLHAHPDAAIKLQMFVLADRRDPIAMAVSPSDAHLLQWLNTYLDQMSANLQIDQIIKKYQGG